jgi:hypothetical protein
VKETHVGIGGKEILKVPNDADVALIRRIRTQGGGRKDHDDITNTAEAVGVLLHTNLPGRNVVIGAPGQKKVEWGGRGDGSTAARML